ncbi:MAG: PD-(D/E)XK nuclease family protein, partial [Chloroflexi bacterium]|nr:PD-(D/E)XK nuclease family protein [Chloroflexota bacterium]
AVRLMYVAATRARDHLIVSTFRKKNDGSSAAAVLARLSEKAPNLWGRPPVTTSAFTAPAPEKTADDSTVPANSLDQVPELWDMERLEIVSRMSAPLSVPASSLHEFTGDSPPRESEEESEDEQIELDPWRRGRAATSIGRAVHAVLQDVDPNDPSTLASLAAQCAAAHDVVSYEKEVHELAAATLKTPVMRRAANAHRKGAAWRESYVSAAVGECGVVVEGYVDLVFEEEDGSLVIVDYKTDRDDTVPERYEAQLGAYIAAVRKATGREVSEAVLVFSRRALHALNSGTDIEAAQHKLADLDGAVEHAIEIASREHAL